MTHKILIAAGGTGGHITPGLAVAEEMHLRGWHVSWVGSPKGMELELVQEQAKIPFFPIDIKAVRGKGILSLINLPLNLSRACIQSISILRSLRPTVVLTFGGYISFPIGVMAALQRYPLVIHEQNAIPGWSNRLLAKISTQTLESFPGTFKNATHTGNPLRKQILSVDSTTVLEKYKKRAGPLRILIIGGSLGAAALNNCLPKAIAKMPEQSRPVIQHQTGKGNRTKVADDYASTRIEAQVEEFIWEMGKAYQEADLVIARAGALTLAEIAQAGVASLLVPYPSAVDDHQTVNSLMLVQAGAAEIIPQKDLSPESLSEKLIGYNRETLANMAIQAKAQSKPHATEHIANLCEKWGGLET